MSSTALDVSEKRDAVVAPEQIAANLRAWILDLRTTNARQTRGYMYMGGEYCCLGRAAVVLGLAMASTGYRPYETVDAAMGLSYDDRAECINRNDGLAAFAENEQSFAQIADYVEREILPRYENQPAATPEKAQLENSHADSVSSPMTGNG